MARWRLPHAHAGSADGHSQCCCCCCCWLCHLPGACRAPLLTSLRSAGAPSHRCRHRECSSRCWRATRPTRCRPRWAPWNGCSTRGSARLCGKRGAAGFVQPAAPSAGPRRALTAVLAPGRAGQTHACPLPAVHRAGQPHLCPLLLVPHRAGQTQECPLLAAPSDWHDPPVSSAS